MKKKNATTFKKTKTEKKAPWTKEGLEPTSRKVGKKKKKWRTRCRAFVCAGNWQEVRLDRVAVAMVWPLFGERKKATKRQLWTLLQQLLTAPAGSDTNLLVPWEVVVIMSSQQNLSLNFGHLCRLPTNGFRFSKSSTIHWLKKSLPPKKNQSAREIQNWPTDYS